jgi:sigma-E factor negative regulatory protein RseA
MHGAGSAVLDVNMTYANEQETHREQLSALADGELPSQQVQALVTASKTDPELLTTWASYHAIGDALRAHASDAYAARVQEVQQVPEVQVQAASPVPYQHTLPMQAAANDSVWRWKLLAGVAALAAVSSVLWSVVGQQGNPGAQLAQRSAPQTTIVAGAPEAAGTGGAVQSVAAQSRASQEEAPVMIRDPRLDELLAAHKQFGGASALQQPAGFLRNATFTPSGR